MASLLQKLVKWGAIFSATIFSIITGLAFTGTKIANQFGTKLAKFAASNFVPVIGRTLAESVETLMTLTSGIRSIVGIYGEIAIILIATMPVLKIFGVSLAFLLGSAITEPFSDSRIVNLLAQIGDLTRTMLCLMILLSSVFVLVISLVMSGNSV
jgi:stage III sporulation protein AE